MRSIIHILVLMVVYASFGQCPNNNNGNNHWENNEDGPRLHINGPYVGKRDHKNFIFGMGWHRGLLTNNIHNMAGGLRAEESDNNWSQNVGSFYLDLSFPFRTERHIAIGINMTFGTLYKRTSGQYSHPSAEQIENYSYFGELNSAVWDTRLRLRQHSYLAFLEVAVWGEDEFTIVARTELGVTRYPFLTKISIESNEVKPADPDCPDAKPPFLYLSGSSSHGLTGGFSLGISLARESFDFRASVGYRFHHMRDVPNVASVSGSGSALHSAHDYINAPTLNSFHATQPADFALQNTWNGLLYFQIGLNLRFGERWYD